MAVAVAVLGRALAAAGSAADAGLHGRALDGCAERGRRCDDGGCPTAAAAADEHDEADGCRWAEGRGDMRGDGLRSDGAREGRPSSS